MSDCDCDCDEGWEQVNEDTIVSFDSRRRTNADLVVDLVSLGVLHDGQSVLDATFNTGKFWRRWAPSRLASNDLAPQYVTDYDYDFRSFPEEWADRWDVVVFDPDYGYRGTSRLASDVEYGLADGYLSVAEREDKMRDGFFECLRVCARGGLVIAKMQDQTVSGAKRYQTKMYWDWANAWADEDHAVHLECELHVHSHRAQPTVNPDGTPRYQKNLHQNYSTAQVWRRVL